MVVYNELGSTTGSVLVLQLIIMLSIQQCTFVLHALVHFSSSA